MFKFLINKNYKRIEQYQHLINKINTLQKTIEILSDDELKQQTPKLKQKLYDGYTLENILPEAFATAKEAIKRVLKLNLFDVQILGGIVLHKGQIAEMKTGGRHVRADIHVRKSRTFLESSCSRRIEDQCGLVRTGVQPIG